MEKKKMTILIVAVVAIVLVAGLVAAFLVKPKEEVTGETTIEKAPLELICLVETETEAKKLADDYGVELIRYNEGVATFRTDKSYEEITKIGKEKGLTELSINDCNTVY